MALNENHPDFPVYKKKWDDLWAQMDEELNKIPPFQEHAGRDGGAMSVIHKKYSKLLKALQEEYKYLYDNAK